MEEIGRRLKAEREAKGVPLEQVQEETKIRRKYLEALENAREADIPGEVYLKGFLRTYANYLGLNGTALVEEYKQSKERLQQDQSGAAGPAGPAGPQTQVQAAPAGVAVAVAPAPMGTVTARNLAGRVAEGKEKSGGPGFSAGVTAVLALGVLGAVSYLGWVLFSSFGGSAQPETPVPTPPVQVTTPKPAEPPPKLPDPLKVSMARSSGEDVIFTVPAKEIQVRLEFGGERPWMMATVDGKEAFQGIPTKPLEFKGSGIRLRMGHMDEISIVVNGQRFDKPLAKGPYTLIFQGQ